MLSDIKKELLNKPESIKNILEHYDYCNVIIRQKYMSFGRDEKSSKKSIVIRLEKNDYLYVIDYARNINQDLISYICHQRGVKFVDVLNIIKHELGISDYYYFEKRKSIFGGFYDGIRKNKSNTYIKTYDKELLDDYSNFPNIRFIRDGISVCSQKYFNIMYDIESQSIVIPIYDQYGQLMGIKARINKEESDGEQKYYYLLPCLMSKTLYGYCQNYKYLTGNIIYVFESEKSVMQCFSFNKRVRNCIAMGSGSLSKKQAQMIAELNPTAVIFMHDVGFDIEGIKRNIAMLKRYTKFLDLKIGYWDNDGGLYDDKVSASDLGEEAFNYIIENEIVMIDEGDDEIDDEQL